MAVSLCGMQYAAHVEEGNVVVEEGEVRVSNRLSVDGVQILTAGIPPASRELRLKLDDGRSMASYCKYGRKFHVFNVVKRPGFSTSNNLIHSLYGHLA
jgi:hypothetical protein